MSQSRHASRCALGPPSAFAVGIASIVSIASVVNIVNVVKIVSIVSVASIASIINIVRIASNVPSPAPICWHPSS